MKTVAISVEEMFPSSIKSEDEVLLSVGQIAGVCYNSSLDDTKCRLRAMNCITRGHHSPWEHIVISLKSVVDRGVSHALVRHRHCAFQQLSTIYTKSPELLIIEKEYTPQEIDEFKRIEQVYLEELPQMPVSDARDILPNATATILIITTNIRQWLYMLQRRNGPGDSSNMHKWCDKTRLWFELQYPTITRLFDEWYAKHPL